MKPEPFDWRLFFKTFPLQPVPVWIACALILRPLARATPWLLRASCEGPAREGVVNAAFILYAYALPGTAATAVYLLVGRRRIAKAPHRLMGDCCLALVLLSSAFMAVTLARSWPLLSPALKTLGGVCWK